MGKVGERGEVARWERWGREVRREGGRFLVLFKGRGRGVSFKISRGRMGFGFSCMVAGLEKLSLNLTQVVKRTGGDVGASRIRDRKLILNQLGARIRNSACGDQ